MIENLPTSARQERLEKNYRHVLPSEKSAAVTKKYPKGSYYVGYQLTETETKALATAADPKCYKCLGTGIKDWRNHGFRARVCVCVPSHTRSSPRGPFVKG